MGIFGAIAEGVVAIKYTANVDEAVAAVKGLSGEQKKAAKEAVEAHKKEREEFRKKVEEFGKGAAIIGGALLVARNGLQAYREESRLMAGAAGVDIDSLSEKWGGLKSRMDLLTLAQAGHQGAWKLTTAQLEKVSEGMRALEKKGFDTAQVFDKFTDVIKKGKLEGLDDFGLSLKATGDQTQDLQVLMRALGREVLDVGGDFTKAGDEVVRATVRMEDGVSRVRSIVGKFSTEVIQAAADFGENLGRFVGGNLTDPQSGQFNAGDQYAYNFARRRAGQPMVPNGSVSAAVAFASGDAQDADFAAAAALGRFRAQVRQAKHGNGPLGTLAPNDFQDVLSTLPQGWREVDPVLGAMADNLRDQLQLRMQTVGVDAAKSVWIGFKTEFAKNAAEVKKAPRPAGRGAKSRGAAAPEDDWLSGMLSGAAGTASGFYDFAMGQAAANQQAQADAMAAYQDRMSQRFADAQMLQDMEAWRTAKAKSDEDSFLAKTFGPLEEFDAYAAGFATLKGAVQDGFAAWISGAESVGTAIRKSIAKSLAGYAIEMAGMALVAGAHGIFHLTNPATAAQGAGELFAAAKYSAAALALAGLAKLASPSGDSNASASAGAGSATGGRGGRSQDHRGEGGGSWRPAANNGGPIVLGDMFDDGSRRYRERQVAAAMARTSTVYQPPRGAAA